jgi:hypothetical protein
MQTVKESKLNLDRLERDDPDDGNKPSQGKMSFIRD